MRESIKLSLNNFTIKIIFVLMLHTSFHTKYLGINFRIYDLYYILFSYHITLHINFKIKEIKF